MKAKKNYINKKNLHPDYVSQLAEIIKSNPHSNNIENRVADYHENDIATVLNLLNAEERAKLYTDLSDQHLADVLAYSENASTYLNEMTIHRRAAVLAHMEPALAGSYLYLLKRDERKLLLNQLDDSVRREISLIHSFGEDEIGRRMTTNYISVCEGCSVREAMHELVSRAGDNDNISTIYVVNSEGIWVGAIDLKDLIIAREGTPLEEITMVSYPYVYAEEEIEQCIERLMEYSENSIPVLDSHHRLMGILTAKEIARLADDEMGEDYAKLAGLSEEEDIREPLKRSIAKRLPWLIILLFLGILVSCVVGIFEQVVASLTLVVCFQSLVLDMAGNVGTQSLAITIRVLMEDQLTRKQKIRLVLKEARVGLCNGLILGVLSFCLIGVYLVWKGEAAALAFSVSMCTGVALLVSMVMASISGTTIPILFKKINIDPAVASGPLITTINDLVAVVSYYGFVWILLLRVIH